ncbi:MAG: type II toxin-antitoxin system VapC family toxin [Candidatus Eremiobacteraeota bacterium]|nr:type II toxin-antitoxin system VapC family toxin [Candidatus Eremiobacteraeota bacterium]
MTEAVLDASVVIKWFKQDNEEHIAAARALRLAVEAGELTVFAPPLLQIEILNAAGRRWRLDHAALVKLAHRLEALPFDLRQPPLGGVAAWTARGLSAYDASYVALAEIEALPLITSDKLILAIAPDIARPLAGCL